MTWQPPEPAYRRLSDLQSGIDNWYSLDQLLTVREQTIEECAKVCEQFTHYGEASGITCVKAIRKLKD